jgi:hypothetical protein
MTITFFSAETQYHPMHEADAVPRPVDPSESTAPLRPAPAAPAGWFVSGIAALVGLATFSIVGAYALDEFTKAPAHVATTAPSVSISLDPPAPVTVAHVPEVKKPARLPRVVVIVPPHRSAPVAPAAPADSPEVTTPPPPPPPPAPPWPPLHWVPPTHWHHHSPTEPDEPPTTDPASPPEG